MPRSDLSLRPDVEWLLREVKVQIEDLCFVEDVELPVLKNEGRLAGLVLVDHNRLAAHQEDLTSSVVEVLDHHVDEKMYPGDAQTTIQVPCGSCSSLVAREILQRSPDLLASHDLTQLLRSAILMDTSALDRAQGRTTDLDEEMEAMLREHAPDTSKAQSQSLEEDLLYSHLMKKRYDISSLGTYDLLRKDYKQWTMETGSDETKDAWVVGISAIAMDINLAVGKDPEFARWCARWAKERQLDILLIMGAYFDNEENFRRQLMIVPFAGQDGFASQVADFLKAKGVPLETSDLQNLPPRVVFYEHTNVKQSRKQIQPLMVDFFRTVSFNKC
mmetsp:Transcript_31713/g.43989  ORF Transcript_31713/g.43989 Transcript_31713/m.43989 type:complete len:331 (-) Transcript_31713:98-1090(-)